MIRRTVRRRVVQWLWSLPVPGRRLATMAEVRAMGVHCVAHRHRELVPIEVHHVHPTAAGGPNIASNKVPLCANAHSSVHDLLAKVVKAGSWAAVPWSVKRGYGYRVRRLARRGFDAMSKSEER